MAAVGGDNPPAEENKHKASPLALECNHHQLMGHAPLIGSGHRNRTPRPLVSAYLLEDL